jgi:hypothetical protein
VLKHDPLCNIIIPYNVNGRRLDALDGLCFAFVVNEMKSLNIGLDLFEPEEL